MTNPCENCQIRHMQIMQDNELTYKMNKQRVEWFKNYQDFAGNYNNTVISLGYAALLFIFSSVKDDIHSMAFIRCFGFFFLFSVALFVISELDRNFKNNEINSVVNKCDNPDQVLDDWFKEYTKQYRGGCYEFLQKYIYFGLSAVTGIIAGLMLIAWCFFPEVFKILKAFSALFYI